MGGELDLGDKTTVRQRSVVSRGLAGRAKVRVAAPRCVRVHTVFGRRHEVIEFD